MKDQLFNRNILFSLMAVVMLLGWTAMSYGAATVSVDPATIESPAVGEQLTVNINIAGGAGVVGYEVDVNFDSTALSYVSIAYGEYLPKPALPGVDPVTISENKVGFYAFGNALDGDHTLATITFEVLEVKASAITLSGVLIAGLNDTTIETTTADGSVTVPTADDDGDTDDGDTDTGDTDTGDTDTGDTDTGDTDTGDTDTGDTDTGDTDTGDTDTGDTDTGDTDTGDTDTGDTDTGDTDTGDTDTGDTDTGDTDTGDTDTGDTDTGDTDTGDTDTGDTDTGDTDTGDTDTGDTDTGDTDTGDTDTGDTDTGDTDTGDTDTGDTDTGDTDTGDTDTGDTDTGDTDTGDTDTGDTDTGDTDTGDTDTGDTDTGDTDTGDTDTGDTDTGDTDTGDTDTGDTDTGDTDTGDTDTGDTDTGDTDTGDTDTGDTDTGDTDTGDTDTGDTDTGDTDTGDTDTGDTDTGDTDTGDTDTGDTDTGDTDTGDTDTGDTDTGDTDTGDTDTGVPEPVVPEPVVPEPVVPEPVVPEPVVPEPVVPEPVVPEPVVPEPVVPEPVVPEPQVFSITLTNLTTGEPGMGGQIFSPPIFATHAAGLALYGVGQPATEALVLLAEGGDTSGIAALAAQVNANTVVGDGMVLPGASVTVMLTADAMHSALSLATMLVSTNDAFVATTNLSLFDEAGMPISTTLELRSYDAGSEQNTERGTDIPGPVGLSAEEDPEGSNARVPTEAGVITRHAGIQGVGDIAASFAWTEPTAMLTIAPYVPAPEVVPVEPPPPLPTYDVTLEAGLNMISVPLMPTEPYTAQSLADMLGSTVVIKLNAATQSFVGYVAGIEGGYNFSIEGGKGYIVNTPAGGTVTFSGTAWSNEPAEMPTEAAAAAPKISTTKSAWAFIVASDLQGMEDGTPYTMVAKNIRTGVTTTEKVSSENGYVSAVWADLNHKSVVESGDKVEIALLDERGTIVSGPFQRTVQTTDIHNAFMSVQMRVGDVRPKETMLRQNFPNPFNPETWIPYQLNRDSNVTIQIFDVSGHSVRTLNLGHKSTGAYMTSSSAAYWDGKNAAGEHVSSGIYFYALQTQYFSATRRMVILK